MSDLLLRGYYAMPVWMQNLMLSAYGLRLRFLRYGRYHRRSLAGLLSSQWLSRDLLLESQLSQLNKMLSHAATNVPFYRDQRLPGCVADLTALSDLPILSKSDIRRAGRELCAPIRARRLLEIHTGGTTGTPLTIYCDRATLQRNYAFFSRLLAWAGVSPGCRVATFAGRAFIRPDQDGPPYWRSNFASNTLLMSSYFLSPQTVDAYIERLVSFKPNLIDAYPSSIEFVARRLLRTEDIRIKPKAIITSSETLTPQVRDLIERAFGCTVFDQYGSAEMAAFVSQCEVGSYHVNPEFGVLEIIRDGRPVATGESGEVVATGFINPVMPLVRYATGDMAVRGGGSCPCGRAFPTLERIEGRMDDVVITPDGRHIGRLDPIFKSSTLIVESRVVQDARDHIRVEVVPDVGYSDADEAALLSELQRRLGPTMRADVRRVASLPKTASGKLRMVVREVGTANGAPSSEVPS